ncbi:class I SAM-dependent methyltransferase [Nocardioides jensenii]|uniref:class I SAM-dependent methyltransferase n=1 Tax=Nocardioides jensenii TaxID=1843 RepID=UPI0008347747|nr:class I SAM-dependent methyltransferase [Nocardioides jensenii]
MGWWVDHVVPRLTDAGLSTPEISTLRRETCARLAGRVLEVGFGSGLNLPHLPGAVTGVAAVEPSDLGWSRSAHRRETAPIPVERVGLDGQSIDLPDSSVDAALVTFSLCTIPVPDRALRELRRVVRPGGRLHFLEHGLAPDAGVARWQGRLNGLQGRVCGGCQLDRDVPALVGDAGFELLELDQRYLPGPRVGRPWTYGYRGVAG